MKTLSRLRKISARAGFWRIVVCVVIVSMLPSVASATAVTYTGFTIANGKLGPWEFHNARVYLKLKSDTNSVVATTSCQVTAWIPTPLCTLSDTTVAYNLTGTASVTIMSGERTVHATFAPNQIFVSIDQSNGGVGFGSFSPSSPGGIEPTYPLGIEDGTIDSTTTFEGGTLSAELFFLPIDLVSSVGYSGRAWVCFGFDLTSHDSNSCSSTPPALKTDKGDFYLSQPYSIPFGDTLSSGFFFVDVGAQSGPDGE
jgi:hypothetical protein